MCVELDNLKYKAVLGFPCGEENPQVQRRIILRRCRTKRREIQKHQRRCEDIRMEQRNLASFMGVYGLTPYAGIQIRDFKLQVAFCMVCFGLPIEGAVDIRLEVRTPAGSRIEVTTFPDHNNQTFSKESACTFAFRVHAIFPTPDRYTLILISNGREFFKDTFVIEQG
jgi:hypothetical protein